MSWLDTVKKNDIDFETSLNKEELDEEEEGIIEEDYNILDPDDEFYRIYSNIVVDLKIEFKDYIDDQAFPFLDNNLNFSEYIFFNFIKYNSLNYKKVYNDVIKENEEYLKMKEEDEENEYNDNIYDNDYKDGSLRLL